LAGDDALEAPKMDKDSEKSRELANDDEFILVKTAEGRIVRLIWSVVSWVEVEGRSLRLHTTTGDSYRWRGTLKSLEQQWGKYGHKRVDKNLMVFAPRIQELRKRDDGYAVDIGSGPGGGEFPVSRRKAREIKQQLEGKE
jgi:DNA-binding LytR/AlgR family response regulator